MGCWKWFNKVLEEVGVEANEENEAKVEDVIHKYIGEQSKYGRCSGDWRKARKEVRDDPTMRQELIEARKTPN